MERNDNQSGHKLTEEAGTINKKHGGGEALRSGNFPFVGPPPHAAHAKIFEIWTNDLGVRLRKNERRCSSVLIRANTY